MSKRFAWLLGVVVLVSIGVLVACGSNYNASSDGLVLVGSQGSGLIETFSFNLNNGGSSAISNTPIGHVGSGVRSEGDPFVDCGGPRRGLRVHDHQCEFIV